MLRLAVRAVIQRVLGGSRPAPAHPNGHFYSPVVDTIEVSTYGARLWPAHPAALGINFDEAAHAQILRE